MLNFFLVSFSLLLFPAMNGLRFQPGGSYSYKYASVYPQLVLDTRGCGYTYNSQ